MRGLRTKLHQFITSSACFNGDIICASETWLHPSISDGEIIDNNFKLFRKDRDSNTSDHKRGGGVLIAIKSDISAEQLETEDNNIEHIFIKVKCTEGDLVIGCVYLPPLSPLDVYINHTNTVQYLKNKYRDCKLLILGDYNLPSSYPQDQCVNLLYSNMFLVNCEQLNAITNDYNKTLDLCFSNTNIKVTRGDPLIYEDKHHPSLNIRVDTLANLKESKSPKYIFKNANYLDLNGFFLTCNWIELYKLESIDDKVDWFYNVINEGIIRHVPVSNNKASKYPVWFSRELISKIREKNTAHAKYKKNQDKATI